MIHKNIFPASPETLRFLYKDKPIILYRINNRSLFWKTYQSES